MLEGFQVGFDDPFVDAGGFPLAQRGIRLCRQPYPQPFQPLARPVQTGFDRLLCGVQQPGGFRRREPLHIRQQQDDPLPRRQLGDQGRKRRLNLKRVDGRNRRIADIIRKRVDGDPGLAATVDPGIQRYAVDIGFAQGPLRRRLRQPLEHLEPGILRQILRFPH